MSKFFLTLFNIFAPKSSNSALSRRTSNKAVVSSGYDLPIYGIVHLVYS